MGRPDRRTVLVSGASSGLGEGVARAFAARGHDLALCARRLDRLEALRAELIAATGARVAVRAVDVADPEQVTAAFDGFVDEFGGLDRVVVNAGSGKGRPIGTGGAATNLRAATVNVLGSLAQCEAAVAHFRSRGRGHLVVVSSVRAARGMGGAATTYAASKAALAILAEGLRVELAGTSIVVSTIFPGYIATAMNAGITRSRWVVDTAVGVRALVAAIEHERPVATVPWWPWAPARWGLRALPERALRRLS